VVAATHKRESDQEKRCIYSILLKFYEGLNVHYGKIMQFILPAIIDSASQG
jgi:hypothetical protein